MAGKILLISENTGNTPKLLNICYLITFYQSSSVVKCIFNRSKAITTYCLLYDLPLFPSGRQSYWDYSIAV